MLESPTQIAGAARVILRAPELERTELDRTGELPCRARPAKYRIRRTSMGSRQLSTNTSPARGVSRLQRGARVLHRQIGAEIRSR